MMARGSTFKRGDRVRVPLEGRWHEGEVTKAEVPGVDPNVRVYVGTPMVTVLLDSGREETFEERWVEKLAPGST